MRQHSLPSRLSVVATLNPPPTWDARLVWSGAFPWVLARAGSFFPCFISRAISQSQSLMTRSSEHVPSRHAQMRHVVGAAQSKPLCQSSAILVEHPMCCVCVQPMPACSDVSDGVCACGCACLCKCGYLRRSESGHVNGNGQSGNVLPNRWHPGRRFLPTFATCKRFARFFSVHLPKSRTSMLVAVNPNFGWQFWM